MQRFLLGTNWKMHKNFSEALDYTAKLRTLAEAYPEYQYFIIPPALYLQELGKRMAGSLVLLGAQNMHWLDEGDFTGELSPAWIADCGAQIAELGHSERRQFYNENDYDLNRKVHAALHYGMRPLLCVGESAQEKMYGITEEVLRRQLKIGLFGVAPEDASRVWIAYEPVWAIGTGKTATAEQAQEIHAFIRKTIADKYGKEVAENCSILYGGSCKPSNAKELFANKDVDGGLIGGAALEVDSFMGIINAF